jgi:hypothetical protein
LLLATVLAAGLVLAAAFHARILTGLAGLLIVDEPIEKVDAVWIAGGDRRFDVAADLYRQDPRLTIVSVEWHPDCLVREGILPSRSELNLRELQKRGVAVDAFELIPGKARSTWQIGRLLDAWLADQGTICVEALCDQFDSRRWHLVLNKTLTVEQRAKVKIRSLRDRRFNERDWWKSRRGVRSFVLQGIGLVCASLLGEQPPVEADFDPDRFEQELREKVEDAGFAPPPKRSRRE